MTDKEVGELWADLVVRGFDFSSDNITRQLIRKLVEERAKHGIGVETVLAEFGIDPETWRYE